MAGRLFLLSVSFYSTVKVKVAGWGSLSVCLVGLSLLFNVMHLLALSTGDSINGQSSRDRINSSVKIKGGSSVDDDGVAHR